MSRIPFVAGAAAAAVALAGCTSTAPQSETPGAPGPITVKAADSSCEISATTAPERYLVQQTYIKTALGWRITSMVQLLAPAQ